MSGQVQTKLFHNYAQLNNALRIFGRNDLDHLASVLSDESCQRIQAEAKRLLANLPNVAGTTGIAAQHLTSIPPSLSQCIEKIKYLLNRYFNLRRVCFLLELSERSSRQQLKAV